MRLLFFLVLLVTGCDTRLSVESQFELTKDSRLPKWLELPQGTDRRDVTVRLTYYTVADPRVEVLKGSFPFQRRLVDVTAKRRFSEPLALDVPGSDPRAYATFEVLVVGDTVDIVEHPHLGPVFRMSDNPDVWAELGGEAPSNKSLERTGEP